MEQVGSIPTAHHKAPSQARSADRLTEQVRGRMSSAPFRKAMPHMTPAARPCAGTAANRLIDPSCDWLTIRAPDQRTRHQRRNRGKPGAPSIPALQEHQ
jgi:metal-dependent amidase/aminoacylase/carboxypeptidase family protein